MRKMLYPLLIILLIACHEKSGDDYATGASKDGIVGKWRLVEIKSSNGTAQISTVNVESENYVVTFGADGTVHASDFSCSGTFTFDTDKPGNIGNNHLTITFEACERSKLVWYSIHGTADARIIDDNTLVLNSEACDEGCQRIYKRLKK